MTIGNAGLTSTSAPQRDRPEGPCTVHKLNPHGGLQSAGRTRWRFHCTNLLPVMKVHNMGTSGMNGPRDSATRKANAPHRRSVAINQATTVRPFAVAGGSSSPLARRCCNSFQACQPKGTKIETVNTRTIKAAKKEDIPAISSGMRLKGPRRKSNRNSQK